MFRHWCDVLPGSIELVAVQLPGRENRFKEAPAANLTDAVGAIADAIPPLLDVPYATFGHSLGTIVSYELILELRRRGQRLPSHITMSGRGAPHLARLRTSAHRLSDTEFIEDLRRMEGTPGSVLQNAELMQLLLPTLRADFALAEHYRPGCESPLPSQMSVYGGLGDTHVPKAHLQAWQEHCAQQIVLRMFPGGHFFLNDTRLLLLQALARDLQPLYEDAVVY